MIARTPRGTRTSACCCVWPHRSQFCTTQCKCVHFWDGFVDLREQRTILLPKILAAVADGEEVTLTRHGRAVAVIVRPDSLRVRRADAAFDVAAQIHDLVREGRHALLPTEQGLTAARADELVAAVARRPVPRLIGARSWTPLTLMS